jgi:hypothetical protein
VIPAVKNAALGVALFDGGAPGSAALRQRGKPIWRAKDAEERLAHAWFWRDHEATVKLQ